MVSFPKELLEQAKLSCDGNPAECAGVRSISIVDKCWRCESKAGQSRRASDTLRLCVAIRDAPTQLSKHAMYQLQNGAALLGLMCTGWMRGADS